MPVTVADAGAAAARRYVEFFAAEIRNLNTRAAYARAASDFFGWCERRGLALPAVQPVHVAAWVEGLGRTLSAPSVKQRLAAVRMLFDWLVVGQVVPHNPAAPVRGPKHSAVKGKTRMPTRDEAKALLAAIPTDGVVGLRDRALIGLLLYTFARVGAATVMRVGDYSPVSKRWWVRLHEKGGRHHEIPCHHTLAEWLDAYIEAAGIEGDRRGPLFRTAEGRSGRLTEAAMTQPDVYRMIGLRIPTEVGHRFRFDVGR
ncbi:tyrosine-type recombinase/integrase [Falsiroseomonas sp. E2-1-a20]|uniref:tyrosine-type recombinase/integrase n=1 Tax=Falsiroseomonas sp. E2-1-a20 TaxID=3239300 RepID=UPI003F35D3D0